MPYAAPRICARCRRLVPAGQTCDCRPPWEGTTHPRDTARWRKVRRNQLRAHPTCQVEGCRLLASEVDHRIPLSEGGDRYDYANLASLCHCHHVEKTTADGQRGKTRRRGHDA